MLFLPITIAGLMRISGMTNPDALLGVAGVTASLNGESSCTSSGRSYLFFVSRLRERIDLVQYDQGASHGDPQS